MDTNAIHRDYALALYTAAEGIGKVNLIIKVLTSLLENDYSASAKNKYKTYINQNGRNVFIKLFLLKKLPTIANLLVKFKGKISLIRNQQVN